MKTWYLAKAGKACEKPKDITEKTTPYYRNADKETSVDRWLHENSSTLLRKAFGGVASIVGYPRQIGDEI